MVLAPGSGNGSTMASVIVVGWAVVLRREDAEQAVATRIAKRLRPALWTWKMHSMRVNVSSPK